MEKEAKIRKVYFYNSKKQKLAGILHENKTNRIVIICHGFTANKNCNFIPLLAENIYKNGFSVLRFDFTGNGNSEGKLSEGTYSQENDDLSKAVDFVKKLSYKEIIVIGHSMGGAVSILRASKDKRINFIITIAAVTYPGKERLTKKQKDDLAKKGYTFYWDKYKINKDFIDDASKYDLTKYVDKIKIPFLIIHGDKDDVVNPEEAKDLYKNANEPKCLEIIKGADHTFGYEGTYKNQKKNKYFKIMKEKILNFLKK